MSSLFPPAENKGRYSGKNNLRLQNFFCHAPNAKAVFICGDFNGWNSTSHPMRRQTDGNWLVQLELTHGHHLYVFIVDGKPALDPRAQGVSRNGKNERVSLILVS